MRKLFATLLASGVVTTGSAALPFVDTFGNGMSAGRGCITNFWVLFPPLVVSMAVPEPATNVLLICGLLMTGGLAIFLGNKLG